MLEYSPVGWSICVGYGHVYPPIYYRIKVDAILIFLLPLPFLTCGEGYVFMSMLLCL